MLHGQVLNIAPTIQALMPALSDVTSKLQYKSRLDSVTKTLPQEFRSSGAVTALIGLGTRFGANNRRLLGGIL